MTDGPARTWTPPVAPVDGRRARNRLERHRAFLAAARRLVAAEGIDALTMASLAAEVDCAVGTAYTYFPSKSALMAELQREAIEVLAESYLLFRARFEAAVAGDGAPARVVAVAHVVGFGRFWVATFDTFPDEARLQQRLLAEQGPSVIDDDDLGRVLPAALRLLDHARTAFEAAAGAGAISAGSAMERTVVLAACLNGVLLLDRVGRVDPDLIVPARLARSTVDDLLAGWGARRTDLDAAGTLLDAMARRGPLAPPLPTTTTPETR